MSINGDCPVIRVPTFTHNICTEIPVHFGVPSAFGTVQINHCA
jgi:hypothetical protein